MEGWLKVERVGECVVEGENRHGRRVESKERVWNNG